MALDIISGIDAMNLAIDAGAPFRETVYATAGKHPAWAAEIRAWHDRWVDMASPGIEESWTILRTLRRRSVPVFALSNFGIDSFAHATTIYPVLTEFDRTFISGHLKCLKPEPRIYEILEAETGLAGADLFFTDDRPDNIAAAEARGWRGHLFEHPSGLAAALAAAGIALD